MQMPSAQMSVISLRVGDSPSTTINNSGAIQRKDPLQAVFEDVDVVAIMVRVFCKASDSPKSASRGLFLDEIKIFDCKRKLQDVSIL